MSIRNKIPWLRWKRRKMASTMEVVHVFSKCEHGTVVFGNPGMMIETGPWWEFYDGPLQAGNERFMDWPNKGDEYIMTLTIERVPEDARIVSRRHVMQHIEDLEDLEGDHDLGF